MIRATLTPQNTDIKIVMPQAYVGRQVEVLVYALDELAGEDKPSYTLADLWGKLSDESAQKLHQHTAEMRNEWHRDI